MRFFLKLHKRTFLFSRVVTQDLDLQAQFLFQIPLFAVRSIRLCLSAARAFDPAVFFTHRLDDRTFRFLLSSKHGLLRGLLHSGYPPLMRTTLSFRALDVLRQLHLRGVRLCAFNDDAFLVRRLGRGERLFKVALCFFRFSFRARRALRPEVLHASLSRVCHGLFRNPGLFP